MSVIALNAPSLRAWIDIPPQHDFPIQNLPFGVFETDERGPRLAVAIGDYVLDLYVLSQFGFFDDLAELGDAQPQVFRRNSLNGFLALGRPAWRAVRQRVSELLLHDNADLRDHPEAARAALVRQRDVAMLRPIEPTSYTRFCSSPAPATTVGALIIDPANTLEHNSLHAPAASYQAPASSIVASGTPIRAPHAQQLGVAPEIAAVVGVGSEPNAPVGIEQAESHVFGLCLCNAWLSTDLLGTEDSAPGLAPDNHFASSLGPWVVTLDALEPFRTAGPAQEPAPLPYLQSASNQHFGIQLEAALAPAGGPKIVLARPDFQGVYWSLAQQLAQHTAHNGHLAVGDVCAASTTSDPMPNLRGTLLTTDTTRTSLLAGDTVTLHAYAEKDGVRIGFGELSSSILPAE